MYARTSYADENTQVPTRPSWMLIPFAIRTRLVPLQFHKALKSLGVPRSALRRWIGSSPRHDGLADV